MEITKIEEEELKKTIEYRENKKVKIENKDLEEIKILLKEIIQILSSKKEDKIRYEFKQEIDDLEKRIYEENNY